MRRSSSAAMLLLLVGGTAGAQTISVVERVKARGAVNCGSVERPGLAEEAGSGRWRGLEVDVCRAVAAAVLGSPDRIAYRRYSTQKEFDAIRERLDDLFFLSGSEILEHKLAGVLVAGPTVFVESHGVMVPSSSPAERLRDLTGEGVCVERRSHAARSLSAYFDRTSTPWLRRPFGEPGEMLDAYSSRSCRAVAGEVTTLASYRLGGAASGMKSRILPERTSSFPLIAATGTDDARWTSIVAWVVTTLISGERPETSWYAGGAGAMPVAAPGLGLDRDWQRRVLAAVGHYGAIFDRNLGDASPLQLERGLNASQAAGGLFLAPFLE